jgi:hypothetical protein
MFVLGVLWAICSMVRSAASDQAHGRNRWAPFILFGCLVAQLYGSYYNVAFTLAILALTAVAALSVPRWRRVLRGTVTVHWKEITAAACMALLVALPAATHYLEVAGTVQPRPSGAALDVLPRLASYLFVTPHSWAYGWMTSLEPFRSLPVRHEHAIGLGFVTSGCLLWVAWRNRDREAVRLVIVVAAVLALLVTMFPGRVRLWAVVYQLFPPFQGVRAVSRIWMLLPVPAGIAIGWMVNRRGRDVRAALITAAAVLACLEQGVTTRSVPVATVTARADELAARVDRTAGAFLVVPSGGVRRGLPWHHLDAMWAARLTGVPTINGYSGNRPPGWDFGDLRLGQADNLDEVRRRLDSWAGTMGLDPGRIQVLVVDATANLPDDRPQPAEPSAPSSGRSGERPSTQPARTPLP